MHLDYYVQTIKQSINKPRHFLKKKIKQTWPKDLTPRGDQGLSHTDPSL